MNLVFSLDQLERISLLRISMSGAHISSLKEDSLHSVSRISGHFNNAFLFHEN